MSDRSSNHSIQLPRVYTAVVTEVRAVAVMVAAVALGMVAAMALVAEERRAV